MSNSRAEEIDDLLIELRRVWQANPELRLGQLIENMAGKAGAFYLPDKALMERLVNQETFRRLRAENKNLDDIVNTQGTLLTIAAETIRISKELISFIHDNFDPDHDGELVQLAVRMNETVEAYELCCDHDRSDGNG